MNDEWIMEESWCNLGNFKLYKIFEKRFAELVKSDPGWTGGADWAPDKAIVERWDEHLKGMGLRVSDTQSGEWIMDPCSKMGHSRWWPQYISVPKEAALKILALGDLP